MREHHLQLREPISEGEFLDDSSKPPVVAKSMIRQSRFVSEVEAVPDAAVVVEAAAVGILQYSWSSTRKNQPVRVKKPSGGRRDEM